MQTLTIDSLTLEKEEEWWRMKEHFQAPDEVTAVLKALLSGSSGVPLLDDCCTKEMVSSQTQTPKLVLELNLIYG